MKIDLNKEIYEGWTVRDFIADLEPFLNMIMRGQSWCPVIKSKEELKKWCMDNQPYYKRYIPDVVNYFAMKYRINK